MSLSNEIATLFETYNWKKSWEVYHYYFKKHPRHFHVKFSGTYTFFSSIIIETLFLSISQKIIFKRWPLLQAEAHRSLRQQMVQHHSSCAS